MRREYRIDSIEIDSGTVFANCYDILYDEPFKKYLGKPESENAILNAQDLLQDETFSINDEVRKEIEEIFSIKALPGIEEAYEENIEKKELSKNLSERFNEIDRRTNNAYNLKCLYEAVEYTEEENKLLEELIKTSSIRKLNEILDQVYQQSFLHERQSIGDIKKSIDDNDKAQGDGKLKGNNSPTKNSLNSIQFRRFPGGKVKIEGRYYPGDLVIVSAKNKKSRKTEEFPYPEFISLIDRDNYQVQIIDVIDFNPKEVIYLKGLDKNGNQYVGYKMTLKGFYETPDSDELVEISKEEYDKLPHIILIDKGDFIIINGKKYKKSEIKLHSSLTGDGEDPELGETVTFEELEKAFENLDDKFMYKFLGNSGKVIKIEPEEIQNELANWYSTNIKKFNKELNKNKKK
jgi:hypothetical protein